MTAAKPVLKTTDVKINTRWNKFLHKLRCSAYSSMKMTFKLLIFAFGSLFTITSTDTESYLHGHKMSDRIAQPSPGLCLNENYAVENTHETIPKFRLSSVTWLPHAVSLQINHCIGSRQWHQYFRCCLLKKTVCFRKEYSYQYQESSSRGNEQPSSYLDALLYYFEMSS